MNAIEELIAEHEAVKMTLNILNHICSKIDPAGKINKPEHLEQLFEFFRVFVDKCHHGKEEELLFPAMEKAGIPREGGPIGLMLSEHQQGRDLVKKMALDLSQYLAGNVDAATELRGHAANYIKLLINHIEKENGILFPMALKIISKEKLSEIKIGFDKIETDRIGVGKHEEFHMMIDNFEKLYLK